MQLCCFKFVLFTNKHIFFHSDKILYSDILLTFSRCSSILSSLLQLSLCFEAFSVMLPSRSLSVDTRGQFVFTAWWAHNARTQSISTDRPDLGMFSFCLSQTPHIMNLIIPLWKRINFFNNVSLLRSNARTGTYRIRSHICMYNLQGS